MPKPKKKKNSGKGKRFWETPAFTARINERKKKIRDKDKRERAVRKKRNR